MGKPLRVLIVEDSPDDVELLLRELKRSGYDPTFERVETAFAMKTALEKQAWDIILSDHSLPSFSGTDALTQLQKSGLDLPFIVVSGVIGEDTAVGYMKAGAHDYVMKNNLARLVPTIEHALKEAKERQKRKQAEEALRESDERLQSILDNAPAIIYVKDLQGKYTFINRQFERLYHIKRDELKHKSDYDFLPRKLADVLHENDQKVIESKTPMEFNEVIPHEDGLHTYISVKFPLFCSNGVMYSICSISTDITEMRQSEEEKTKLREQLYHAQRLESVGKFAGSIAHDFNNILSAIIGYGELLQKKIKGDDVVRDYVQRILSSAERGTNLTHRLLTFSRKQVNNPKPVHLNMVIKGTEYLVSRLIREDIKLTILLTAQECTVMADSSQIEQVLMNLATNARDAMPHGGSLTISTDVTELDNEFIKAHGCGKVGPYALLSVSDTGIGMDEETKKRIFEPFFTTKKHGEGTGLGLSIVYGIVKQHRGYITVCSEPGKGTTFKIYLPIIQPPAEEKQNGNLPDPVRGTETILVAEKPGLDIKHLVD